ncbi:MAG: O-antigen ligase family protein [Candidatus Omnitrophica bacterium]|nr:O-antigen ligase family protein [Candidatus Omnitrophota bacterium]
MPNRSGQATIGLIGLFFFVFLFLVLIFLKIPLNISLAVILGAVIFCIAFINTDLALIILIFSMLLSPQFATGQVTGRAVKIRADDIFIIVVFLGWMAKLAVNKEMGLLRPTPLNAPIAVYIIICLFSSTVAIFQNRLGVKTSFFYLLKYIEYFMLFFMVINNLRSMEQAKKFIFFLFLTCFLVSIYGIFEARATGRAAAPFEIEGQETNTFAGYLVFLMSLIIGSLLYPRSRASIMPLLITLGVAASAFLMTLSRSGWAGFIVAFAALVLLNKKYRIHLIAVFLLTAMILPILAPESVHRRIKETFAGPAKYKILGKKLAIDESGQARIDSWKIGFMRWTKRPFIGYGVPAGVVIDNQYTRVLNETGIFGMVSFMWLLFTMFMVAWRTKVLTEDDNFCQAVTIGFLAGFAGLLLLGTTAAVFIIIRIMEPFWFVLAIVTVLPDLLEEGGAVNA